MPTKRDNEEERFARIDALMEEYRVNHDDLEEYVKRIRERVSRRDADARQTRENIETRMTSARRRIAKTRDN